MPPGAKTPDIKETNDEGISVTDDTDKQVIDLIDEDLESVGTSTQEELDALPPDHGGQFTWLIFLLGFINLKLVNDY